MSERPYARELDFSSLLYLLSFISILVLEMRHQQLHIQKYIYLTRFLASLFVLLLNLPPLIVLTRSFCIIRNFILTFYQHV